MNELELKYGCNPNQKPSRIFMENGADLPIEVLNGKPVISTSLMLSIAGSWFQSLKQQQDFQQQRLLSM